METRTKEDSRLIDDFEQAVLIFDKIQQEHVLSLQQNQLGDVQRWTDQRSQAMGRLQQSLSALWHCDSLRSDARLGRSLQQRIGQMVERERELSENVKLCQQQLNGEIGKMRKGKKVIGHYGMGSVQNTGRCFRNSM